MHVCAFFVRACIYVYSSTEERLYQVLQVKIINQSINHYTHTKLLPQH